jgi:hypothetical protein
MILVRFLLCFADFVELVKTEIKDIKEIMGEFDLMIADKMFDCFRKKQLLGEIDHRLEKIKRS